MEREANKTVVENVGQPGKTYRVDAAKYAAKYAAMRKVLPHATPGMTVEATIAAVKPHLPVELFPGGEKAGWWVKCVQLDLEAKNIITRTPSPVRLYRVRGNS
ncbi:MAG: hypothetical protein ABI398_07500 [Devosia sp.]